jgi:hypothetical protein
MNTGWPLIDWPLPYADYLQYDWHSGTLEFADAGTVRFGFGGFGAWVHGFNQVAVS